jgi:homoserine kinase
MSAAPRQVRAYAPASIGNFAAGFDLLGGALAPLDGSLLGDQVRLQAAREDAFRVTGPFAALLAAEPRKNLVVGAYELYRARLRALDLPCGPFAITLDKRLPLNSGLGSSASSIVATLAGLQALCGHPLGDRELLDLAGQAEGIYSGAPHWDNVAPSLLGGLRLQVPGEGDTHAVRGLPWPQDLVLAVVHPEFQLPTALSRAALPSLWPMGGLVAFAENLAAFTLALHTGDRALLARCLKDPVAEPHRAGLVPGFHAAKAAALQAGALGCSLSGSGPSLFAVASSPALAATAAEAIVGAFAQAGLGAQTWLCALDPQGARILPWS